MWTFFSPHAIFFCVFKYVIGWRVYKFCKIKSNLLVLVSLAINNKQYSTMSKSSLLGYTMTYILQFKVFFFKQKWKSIYCIWMAEVAPPTYYSVYYAVHCYKSSAVWFRSNRWQYFWYILSFCSYFFLQHTKSTMKNPNHDSFVLVFFSCYSQLSEMYNLTIVICNFYVLL